ncbi:MAG: undecaprenyl-phosphate glucose phosphotransferase [Proteobacteria bacterium]|nr:undecaprenyl-phosphate glucose phosphotransferase [Pseudomonadota bacterium]
MVDSGTIDSKFPYGLLLMLGRLSSAIVTVTTLVVCMWLYDVPVSQAYHALTIVSALLALILLPGSLVSDIQPGSNFWNNSVSIVSRSILLVGILLILGYATKTSSLYSRKLLFTWMLVTPPLIALAQTAIEAWIVNIRMARNRKKRFVVVGGNELGLTIADKITGNSRFGLTFDGFFDDRSTDRLTKTQTVNLRGHLKDLPDYVRRNNIDFVFITLPLRNIQRVSELLDETHDTTASIYYVPDIFVFDLIQCRTDDIDGVPIIALCETPFYGTSGLIKRFSDIAIASVVLAIVAPLLLTISVAIRITSPGSIIFKQRRYGLDGHEIVVYKFRTMTVSEDDDVVRQATRNDERITKIGAFLRKYSLDELPQFVNVLQGRMSVVGPRPHAVAHNEEYRKLIKGYMIRHKVNPGITGLAQVQGYRGETSSVDDMRHRIEADLEYLRNWSLTLDFRIILQTISGMWNDKTAY